MTEKIYEIEMKPKMTSKKEEKHEPTKNYNKKEENK